MIGSVGNDMTIVQLKDQYSGSFIYEDSFSYPAGNKPIDNTGFLGSKKIISLSTQSYMIHRSPACLAAPTVDLVSKKHIVLGYSIEGKGVHPVRIYSTDQLSISADEVCINHLKLLAVPQEGFITCKKLSLEKHEEFNENIEVVKSWVVNDDTEITTCDFDDDKMYVHRTVEIPSQNR